MQACGRDEEVEEPELLRSGSQIGEHCLQISSVEGTTKPWCRSAIS